MAKIKKHRKVTYYIGLALIGAGFLLFISVFFSAASAMSDPFSGRPFLPFGRAVAGMVMIIIGGIVTGLGARGAAGSGLILDPDRAREDLKPFNEAKGGMINDVISNIDALDDITLSRDSKEIIKIKCRSCGSLNDEDARFCKSCGKEIE